MQLLSSPSAVEDTKKTEIECWRGLTTVPLLLSVSHTVRTMANTKQLSTQVVTAEMTAMSVVKEGWDTIGPSDVWFGVGVVMGVGEGEEGAGSHIKTAIVCGPNHSSPYVK